MFPALSIGDVYRSVNDTWNASAYEVLSVAWRVSKNIKTHSAVVTLAYETWKLDGLLRRLLEQIDTAVKNPPPPSPEPVTAEQISEAAKVCRQIHKKIDEVYMRAKRAGLINRRLLGAAFNSVKVRSEEILEIGEALALSLDSDVDALLDKSLADLRNGVVYDLPSFK